MMGESELTPMLFLRLCWCKGLYEFVAGDMALAETYILQVKEMLTDLAWRAKGCPSELPLPHTGAVLSAALLEDKLGVLYHKALIQSSKALFANSQHQEVVDQLAPLFLFSPNAEANASGFSASTRKVLFQMLAEVCRSDLRECAMCCSVSNTLGSRCTSFTVMKRPSSARFTSSSLSSTKTRGRAAGGARRRRDRYLTWTKC